MKKYLIILITLVIATAFPFPQDKTSAATTGVANDMVANANSRIGKSMNIGSSLDGLPQDTIFASRVIRNVLGSNAMDQTLGILSKEEIYQPENLIHWFDGNNGKKINRNGTKVTIRSISNNDLKSGRETLKPGDVIFTKSYNKTTGAVAWYNAAIVSQAQKNGDYYNLQDITVKNGNTNAIFLDTGIQPINTIIGVGRFDDGGPISNIDTTLRVYLVDKNAKNRQEITSWIPLSVFDTAKQKETYALPQYTSGSQLFISPGQYQFVTAETEFYKKSSTFFTVPANIKKNHLVIYLEPKSSTLPGWVSNINTRDMISGAKVVITNNDTGEKTTKYSDRKGHFYYRIDHLAKKYTIEADKNGYYHYKSNEDGSSFYYTSDNGQMNLMPIPILLTPIANCVASSRALGAAGKPTSGAASDCVATLEGNIIDTGSVFSGGKIPGATVSIDGKDKQTKSDSAGHYKIENIAPDKVTAITLLVGLNLPAGVCVPVDPAGGTKDVLLTGGKNTLDFKFKCTPVGTAATTKPSVTTVTTKPTSTVIPTTATPKPTTVTTKVTNIVTTKPTSTSPTPQPTAPTTQATTTGTLTVFVRNNSGNPISGAAVKIPKLGFLNFTDTTGKTTFPNTPSGVYVPGDITATYGKTGYNAIGCFINSTCNITIP